MSTLKTGALRGTSGTADTLTLHASDGSVQIPKLKVGSDAAGDVLYHNGTNYTRLPKGTAGQALKMNSGATAPEWGTDSGGMVLVGQGTGAGASSLSIDNVFTSTYKHYKFVYSWAESDWLKMRWLKSDGSELSSVNYAWAGYQTNVKWSDTTVRDGNYRNITNYAPLHYWDGQSDSPGGGEITIMDPCNASTDGVFVGTFWADDGTYAYWHSHGLGCNVQNAYRGIKIWGNVGDNFTSTNFFWSMYGFART